MPQPKSTLEKIMRVITAWETLATDKTFGGMTLAQFKAGVKTSLDTREELRVLESQMQSKQIERDNADLESTRLVQLVVNGVIGDPTEGPESDLYAAFGYTRPSERKTGLTRKKRPGGADNGGTK
jgi:uncharacterized membrane protein